MTIDEFIDDIKQLAFPAQKWLINEFGQIRNQDGYCPICSLGSIVDKNPRNFKLNYFSIASNLGLIMMDGYKIALAADDEANPEIRQRLIKALGLDVH